MTEITVLSCAVHLNSGVMGGFITAELGFRGEGFLELKLELGLMFSQKRWGRGGYGRCVTRRKACTKSAEEGGHWRFVFCG